MAELPAEVTRLLRAGKLEHVERNPEHARSVQETAKRHLDTAALLSGTQDHAMAFTAAYDAARKALSAVLALHGLRARPVGGAHVNTGRAAAAFVVDDALAEFEWMRQVRNATEYPDDARPTASAQDVAEAIEASTRIVEACARHAQG